MYHFFVYSLAICRLFAGNSTCVIFVNFVFPLFYCQANSNKGKKFHSKPNRNQNSDEEVSDEENEDDIDSNYRPSTGGSGSGSGSSSNSGSGGSGKNYNNENKIISQLQSPHRPIAAQPSSSNTTHKNNQNHTFGSKNVIEANKNTPEEHSLGTSTGTEFKKINRSNFDINKDMEREKEREADEIDIGFVPSFLEPGRQPRQKRFVTCF